MPSPSAGKKSGRDVFDPEDTNYCTFRWITSDNGYAMSCLRANPLTGEMIDGDVVFDASFIRYWKQQYALLIGSTTAQDGKQHVAPLAIGEVISPILASKMGYGQPASTPCSASVLSRKPQPDDPRSRSGRPEFLLVAILQEPGGGEPRLLPVSVGLAARFRSGRHRPGRDRRRPEGSRR